MHRRLRRAGLILIAVHLVIGVAAPAVAITRTLGQSTDQAIDCVGPVDRAQPGTPEWDELTVANAFCTRERHEDKRAHRVLEATAPADAYREPTRHDGVRFRYDTATIGGLEAEVYRPCAAGTCRELPDELETFEPPYPAVVVFHGGASNRRLHWWASQPLAEAGYMVVAFDSPAGPTPEDASTVVDWLHRGGHLTEDFDGERLGIAGHSRGGVVVSEFGQRDPRVSAIVSWDRAQSTPLPADLALQAPTLFMFADYNCQNVPVCEPEVYETAPDPDGPGNKGDDFVRLKAAGVDTMQIPLRAALHLDWVPSQLSGNRYAEAVTVYYTLAWFDRYVRGGTDPEFAAEGFERLTAAAFDDSADRHNVSQGMFDPDLASSTDPYAGNVPYSIAGLRVADRLSFYFRAKCFLTAPGSSDRVVSTDLRTEGCEAGAGAEPQPGSDVAAGAPDAGSSTTATVLIVVGAIVVIALLLSGLVIAYRRSVHGRAASDG